MAVTKALIKIEPNTNIAPKNTIECLFNPEQLSISKSVTWSADDTPFVNAPTMSFRSGGAATLDLELMLDTTDTGDPVTTYTNQLLKLTEINDALPKPSAAIKRPPTVHFLWGDFVSFESYVKSLSITYTYFASDGTPLRANAKLSLEQAEDDRPNWPNQNPTSGTPQPHRVHVVQAGETIDNLAVTYFGKPDRWKLLAELNDIDDPLRLAPGTRLRVPVREEVADV